MGLIKNALEIPFGLAVVHHGFEDALAFEGTAQAADEFPGDGFGEGVSSFGF